MLSKLRAAVEAHVVPAAHALGLRVVGDVYSPATFGNASVELEGPHVRVRIVRERSQILYDVGPTADGNVWFDGAIVMEYLGLSAAAEFPDVEEETGLQACASFLRTFAKELNEMFAPQHFAATRRALERLLEQRSLRRWG